MFQNAIPAGVLLRMNFWDGVCPPPPPPHTQNKKERGRRSLYLGFGLPVFYIFKMYK
jgi:hypothetical protein